jgi:hypothetical protein
MKAIYHAVPVIVYARIAEGYSQSDTHSRVHNALTGSGLIVMLAEDFDDAIVHIDENHVLSGNITDTCPLTEWKLAQQQDTGLGLVRLVLCLILLYALSALTYFSWLYLKSQ